MTFFLNAIGGGPAHPTYMERGYYQLRHWSGGLFLPRWEEWPNVPSLESAYGVCDGLEQFKALAGAGLDSAPMTFVVFLTQVRRADQSPEGGWRWHKWGPYVGVQTPTCEYLRDEPHIEEVWTYHVYGRALP